MMIMTRVVNGPELNGEVQVLSCDNLIGKGFPEDVATRMVSGYKVLQYEHSDGTCGRIACWRKDFLDIRGYDEESRCLSHGHARHRSRAQAQDVAQWRCVQEGEGDRVQSGYPKQSEGQGCLLRPPIRGHQFKGIKFTN